MGNFEVIFLKKNKINYIIKKKRKKHQKFRSENRVSYKYFADYEKNRYISPKIEIILEKEGCMVTYIHTIL